MNIKNFFNKFKNKGISNNQTTNNEDQDPDFDMDIIKELFFEHLEKKEKEKKENEQSVSGK